MTAPDGLTRCAACDEPIAPHEMAHYVHEDRCTDADWCNCDTTAVHRRCCRDCYPPAIEGQIEAFPDLPAASTARLPKKAVS